MAVRKTFTVICNGTLRIRNHRGDAEAGVDVASEADAPVKGTELCAVWSVSTLV